MKESKDGSKDILIARCGLKIKLTPSAQTVSLPALSRRELSDLRESMLTSGISAVTVELIPEDDRS